MHTLETLKLAECQSRFLRRDLWYSVTEKGLRHGVPTQSWRSSKLSRHPDAIAFKTFGYGDLVTASAVPGVYWDDEAETWFLDPRVGPPRENVLELVRAIGRNPLKLPPEWDPYAPPDWLSMSPTLMTGQDFERFLKELYQRLGYKVRLTPTSRDFGADLIVAGADGTLVVQAKRQQRTVGVGAVQEIHGAKTYYRAKTAAVVTTSTFTPAAEKLARRLRVALHDGEWVKQQLFALRRNDG